MKLYHVMCHWMGMLTRVQNSGGTASLKFGKTNNVQNLVRFKTTSEFDREYLWNELRHRQAVTVYSTLNAKKFEDLCLQITKLCWLIPTYPSLTVCAFSKNFRF